jgi:hypothetical protein
MSGGKRYFAFCPAGHAFHAHLFDEAHEQADLRSIERLMEHAVAVKVHLASVRRLDEPIALVVPELGHPPVTV